MPVGRRPEVTMNHAILVGLDGSEQSRCALEWAAGEAALRSAPLHLLHAIPWPLLGIPIDPHRTDAWENAQRLLVDAERRATDLAPCVEVTSELVKDSPATALIRRAEHADLVVVGTRGHGGFAGLVIGSVALRVAAHAPCSVVVTGKATGPPTEPREIVVGVGDQPATVQLQAAFEEAALRSIGLRALYAWRFPETTPDDMVPLICGIDEIERAARRHLAEALTGWREKYQEVPVTAEVVTDRAQRALVKVSHGAGLLVVGARDHGGLLATPLGSVTHAVLHRATCPVLVARGR
jgi:nucleotide-binding universal stress UspA family protein